MKKYEKDFGKQDKGDYYVNKELYDQGVQISIIRDGVHISKWIMF